MSNLKIVDIMKSVVQSSWVLLTCRSKRQKGTSEDLSSLPFLRVLLYRF